MEKRDQPRKKNNAGNASQSYTFQDMHKEISDISDTPSNSNYSGSYTNNGAKPKSNSYGNPSSSGYTYFEGRANGRARGKYRKDVPFYPKYDAKHSQKTFSPQREILKEKINSSVNAFRKSKNNFSDVYVRWVNARELTIEKLETLIGDLHKEQLEFNIAQRNFREIGHFSRSAKCKPSTINTVAGVFAFLSDVASGIASVVQAVNVNEYSEKFKEIMDTDAEVTKDLYKARSQCVMEYQEIEEITRTYHPPTFKSTASRISNELALIGLWKGVSNAYDNDDVSKMLSVVVNFIEGSCQLEILQKIGDSLVTYVGVNTPVLDACNSAARAVCGAIDLADRDKERSATRSCVAHVSHQLMLMDDKKQIARLNCMIDDDSSQSKLEDKIQDAIHSLEFEMKQIVDAYNQRY